MLGDEIKQKCGRKSLARRFGISIIYAQMTDIKMYCALSELLNL